MSRAIIFCGLPGSGKTTLSEIVSERLGIVRCCEDDVKIELYRQKSGTSLQESDRFSREVNVRLFQFIDEALESGHDIVCDATFDRLGNADRIAHIAESGHVVRVVVCRIDEPERERRFRSRERHPAHHDAERCFMRNDFDYRIMSDPKLFLDTDTAIGDSVECILSFLED
ncbi:MAG: ATP-binding protein [Candidatus Moranbacteria bacterium]|nr:ATP-binding protein [Candidatus Moranbacteria bacterium]